LSSLRLGEGKSTARWIGRGTGGRDAAAQGTAARRRTGPGVYGVGSDKQRAHFRLRRAEQDKALAFGVDSVNQSGFVSAGINHVVRPRRDTKDMILLGRVEEIPLAVRRHAVNASFGTGAGVDRLAIGTHGERPHVGFGRL